MVLESLVNPFRAEKDPWQMFFVGLLYSSVAIVLTLLIFERDRSLAFVFLTVLASVPIMYNTIKMEEKKDTLIESEIKLLKEHGRAIYFFIFLFLGFLISFLLWYVLLPLETSQNLFLSQQQTIQSINRLVSGDYLSSGTFFIILSNNIRVLFFCILFAFFFGAGAIFILTWNASVIAAAMGNFFRIQLSNLASGAGFNSLAHYFQATSLSLLRYMLHAIPEIAAYFIAGLAGGIISVAVIRHDFRSHNFQKIVLDSSTLIMISLVLLIFAALIETYITPLLF